MPPTYLAVVLIVSAFLPPSLAQYGPPAVKGKKHRTTTTTPLPPDIQGINLGQAYPGYNPVSSTPLPDNSLGSYNPPPQDGGSYWWQNPNSPFSGATAPAPGPSPAPQPQPGYPGGCGAGGAGGCGGTPQQPVNIQGNPFLSGLKPGGGAVPPIQPTGQTITCSGPGNVCVPKNQCSNGVVVTDGRGSFDVRSEVQYCDAVSQACCHVPSGGSRPSGDCGGYGSGEGCGQPAPQPSPYPGQPAPQPYPYPGQPAPQPSPYPGQPAPQPSPYPGQPAPQPSPYPQPSGGNQNAGPGLVHIPPSPAGPSHPSNGAQYPSASIPSPTYSPPGNNYGRPGTNGIPIGGSIYDGAGRPPVTQAPQRPYTGPQNTTPHPGCAAALKCVPESYCTAEGVMANSPVTLTREQYENRVPLSECADPDTGAIGKCCRDPNYKDPWPGGMMMMKGGNGGGAQLPQQQFVPQQPQNDCGPSASCQHPYQCAGHLRVQPTKNCRVPHDGASGVCCSNDQLPFPSGQPGGAVFPGSIPAQQKPHKKPTSGYPQLKPSAQPFPQPTPQQPFPQTSPSQKPYPQTSPSQQQFSQTSPSQQPFPQKPSNQPFPQNLPSSPYPQPKPSPSPYPQPKPSSHPFPQPTPSQQPHLQTSPSHQPFHQTNPSQQPYPQPSPSNQPFPQTIPSQQTHPQIRPSQPSFPHTIPSQQSYPQTRPSQPSFPHSTSQQPHLQTSPSQQQFPQTSPQQTYPQRPSNQPFPQNLPSSPYPQSNPSPSPQPFPQPKPSVQPFPSQQPQAFPTAQPSQPIPSAQPSPYPRPGKPVHSNQPQQPSSPNFPGSQQLPGQVSPTPGAECGIRRQVSRQGLADTDAGFSEFPWQALVVSSSDQKPLCSAVIISDRAVITAAHCLQNLESNDIAVQAGVWKLNSLNPPKPSQTSHVAAISRHPKFDAGSLFNDLAVLVLSQPLKFDEHIDKICLPPKGQDISQLRGVCTATGWGKPAIQGNVPGSILHQVPVQLIPHNTCEEKLRQTHLGRYFILNPSFQCAVPAGPSQDLCKVDAGGPIACDRGDGHLMLSGLYSWDVGCSVPNSPTVLGGIDTDWIESVLARPVDDLVRDELNDILKQQQQEELGGVDIDNKPGFSQGYGKK